MIQQQVYILNNLLMLLDALCVIGAGYIAVYVKFFLTNGQWSIGTVHFVGSVMVVMFVNNYFFGYFHLYSDQRSQSKTQLIWSIFRSLMVSFSGLIVGIFLFKEIEYSRGFLLVFAVVTFLLLVVQRLLMHLYINHKTSSSYAARRILVVGSLERGCFVSDLMSRQLSWGHEMVGRVALDGQDGADESVGIIADLPEILRTVPVDEVVFAIDENRAVNLSFYLSICREMGIPARILPALWHPGDDTISVERCQGVPFLTIQTVRVNATGMLYKRILDLVGGMVGFLFFALLYPVVGLAIKLDSPGPVLFAQKRMGQNGRVFNIYKFRTMYSDAEERKNELLAQNEMHGAMFKVKDDPRITRVGRFLRKTSLDEFPQFINVLRGEMSLVGTRPPLLSEVNEYQTWHLKRIAFKPGITGLWQVSGRNEITDFDKVVGLDCQYLDNWRFSDDLKILARTVLVVLRRKGAI